MRAGLYSKQPRGSRPSPGETTEAGREQGAGGGGRAAGSSEGWHSWWHACLTHNRDAGLRWLAGWVGWSSPPASRSPPPGALLRRRSHCRRQPRPPYCPHLALDDAQRQLAVAPHQQHVVHLACVRVDVGRCRWRIWKRFVAGLAFRAAQSMNPVILPAGRQLRVLPIAPPTCLPAVSLLLTKGERLLGSPFVCNPIRPAVFALCHDTCNDDAAATCLPDGMTAGHHRPAVSTPAAAPAPASSPSHTSLPDATGHSAPMRLAPPMRPITSTSRQNAGWPRGTVARRSKKRCQGTIWAPPALPPALGAGPLPGPVLLRS